MSGNLMTGKPVSEVIKARTAVRTYKVQPLSADLEEKLAGFFPGLTGPFGIKTRFKLIDSDMAQKESGIKLGTYGVIKGASKFLAAAVEKADKDLEEFGYLLEKLILYATSLGLGTCWLGGSFKQSEFAKAVDLKENEIIPAVTPVGYPSGSKSLLESIMRFSARSDTRKGWNELFFDRSFANPLCQAGTGKYAVPLEMVRLAPSASNKQPWRIVRAHDRFHFYLQHTKGYAKMLPYDIQRLDIGIAMCHFELTAKEAGIKGNWEILNPGTENIPQLCDYVVSWVEG